jgi:HlyD family secretion protein
MFIRGTNISVPVSFVRVQPFVSPKIQLSNARTEKVDLRVLPLVFRFTPPAGTSVYPGQLVDVYLAQQHGEVASPIRERGASGASP